MPSIPQESSKSSDELSTLAHCLRVNMFKNNQSDGETFSKLLFKVYKINLEQTKKFGMLSDTLFKSCSYIQRVLEKDPYAYQHPAWLKLDAHVSLRLAHKFWDNQQEDHSENGSTQCSVSSANQISMSQEILNLITITIFQNKLIKVQGKSHEELINEI